MRAAPKPQVNFRQSRLTQLSEHQLNPIRTGALAAALCLYPSHESLVSPHTWPSSSMAE